MENKQLAEYFKRNCILCFECQQTSERLTDILKNAIEENLCIYDALVEYRPCEINYFFLPPAAYYSMAFIGNVAKIYKVTIEYHHPLKQGS